MGGRREEEHLRPDVLGAQFAGLGLGAVLPPGRRLDEGEVADHQPVQVGHPQPLQPGVGGADGRILTEQEVALADAVQLGEHGVVGAVRAGQPRQMVEAEVVVGSGRVAVVGLEQTDEVRPHLAPETLVGTARRDKGVEVLVGVRMRHRQIAGQQVEERGDVAGALDGRVAAQRLDTAAGAPDVPQQKLEHTGRPDELGAGRMLGPAHRVDERAGALAPGIPCQRLAHLQERLAWHPTGPLDHLGGVAGVVPLEDLVDAAGVLQRRVLRCAGVGLGAARPMRLGVTRHHLRLGRAVPEALVVQLLDVARRRLDVGAFVLPALGVVLPPLLVQAGEDAVEILGVAEVLADQGGGVRIGEDVLPEVLLLAQDVMDDPAEEGDVAARPDRHMQIAQGAGTGEARIDMNDPGTPGLGLHDPLEADRVRLGEIGALDDDAVRVLEILHEGGRPAAPERGTEAGDRGAVAHPGLILHLDHAEAGQQLLDQVVLLVVEGRAAQAGDAERPGDPPAVLLPLPGVTAQLDHPLGDHVHGGVEVQRLPLGPVRAPVEHLMAP